MSDPIFPMLNEVVERYRGEISEGTLRILRSMRIGPSFPTIGKAVLYPLEELDRRDWSSGLHERSLNERTRFPISTRGGWLRKDPLPHPLPIALQGR